MEDARVGSVIRAIRERKRLRQADVAAAAEVSQQAVSDLEHGRFDSIAAVRRVCRVLGASVSLNVEWRGGDVDRFIDARHARLVELTAAYLRARGWEAIPEFSFNHYGDRGSVGVLAWHSGFRTLLVIEVKTSIRNLSELFRRLDVKARVVPRLAAATNAWNVRHVAVVLVVPGSSGMRRAVRSHEATFAAALPARTVELKGWLRCPDRPIKGVLFVADTAPGGTKSRQPSGHQPARRAQLEIEGQ